MCTCTSVQYILHTVHVHCVQCLHIYTYMYMYCMCLLLITENSHDDEVLLPDLGDGLPVVGHEGLELPPIRLKHSQLWSKEDFTVPSVGAQYTLPSSIPHKGIHVHTLYMLYMRMYMLYMHMYMYMYMLYMYMYMYMLYMYMYMLYIHVYMLYMHMYMLYMYMCMYI